jgi:hypothetical protein
MELKELVAVHLKLDAFVWESPQSCQLGHPFEACWESNSPGEFGVCSVPRGDFQGQALGCPTSRSTLPALDDQQQGSIAKKGQELALDDSVLVKFGCQTVHKSFVLPSDAYSALQLLHSDDSIRAALSGVLPGVWRVNGLGAVTITKELVDFGPIKPEELSAPGEIQNLWNGFIDLNKRVLIPMANMGIVHADLRPGWAETSNILRKRLPNGIEMLELIDYESVCELKDVPTSNTDSTFCADYDRSVENEDYTALRHLWWQCMFIADTWAMKKNIETGIYDACTFVHRYHSKLLDAHFWGNIDPSEVEKIEKEETITAEMVLRTLQILSEVPGLSHN